MTSAASARRPSGVTNASPLRVATAPVSNARTNLWSVVSGSMVTRLRVTAGRFNPAIGFESDQLPVELAIGLALGLDRRTGVRHRPAVPAEELAQLLLRATQQDVAQVHRHLPCV